MSTSKLEYKVIFAAKSEDAEAMMNKAAARGSAEVEALLRDWMRWAEGIVASEKGTRGETRKLSQYCNSALVGRV